MAASYDEAVAELYRSPHDAFVAERQRLARELKAAGDKPGAARLLKLGRPTLSAWAVNQLWWHARESFEQLLAAAARLRAGDQAGATDRRDAVAALKARAAALLVEGGHAVNEATLRRVTTTLSALAAAGGFDPEPPGALAADRDPPGFDAAGLGAAFGGAAPASAAVMAPAAQPPPPKPKLEPPPAKPADPGGRPSAAKTGAGERALAESDREQADRERAVREQADRERVQKEAADRAREQRERAEREEADRRQAEQEQRRVEQQRAALRAERQRLEASLPSLRADLERRQREVERLRAELRRVEGLAAQAHTAIDDAEKRVAALAAND